MNPLFSLFKFLLDDFKSDIATIKRIFQEKGFFEARAKVILLAVKSLTISDLMMYIFPLLLFMALAFFVGWYLAGTHYHTVCYNFILDNYAPKMIESNLTLDFGKYKFN